MITPEVGCRHWGPNKESRHWQMVFLIFLISRTVSGFALNLSGVQTAFPSGRVEGGVIHSSPGVCRTPSLPINRKGVQELGDSE